jgi:glucokinase
MTNARRQEVPSRGRNAADAVSVAFREPIYSIESGPRTPLAQTEVRSADYSSLRAVVAEFLEDVDFPVDVGSFAVAGPVIAGM